MLKLYYSLNVQFFKGKEPTARMRVTCHVVPPTAVQHDLLLGRDSFLTFQNHTYAALPREAGKPVEGVLTLSQNTEKYVALIQPTVKRTTTTCVMWVKVR